MFLSVPLVGEGSGKNGFKRISAFSRSETFVNTTADAVGCPC